MANVLVQLGEHSHAMRQMRFNDLREITVNDTLIRDYITQAIQIEKESTNWNFPGSAKCPGWRCGFCQNVQLPDAGPPARISAAFLASQTLKNPQVTDRHIQSGNHGRQGTGRAMKEVEQGINTVAVSRQNGTLHLSHKIYYGTFVLVGIGRYGWFGAYSQRHL